MTHTYDTEFAHAVRLAATGIRPKAGVDVALAAAALEAILKGGQALDPHGLELLALAVTGKLGKSRKLAVDETRFALAVRRASAAWRSGKCDSPSKAGAALAIILRSGGRKIGHGERIQLAELFSPLKPDADNAFTGRPPKGAGHADVVAVVKSLKEKRSSGILHKNAIADTAVEFKISKRTVEKYEAMSKERDEALNTSDKVNN